MASTELIKINMDTSVVIRICLNTEGGHLLQVHCTQHCQCRDVEIQILTQNSALPQE
jgi:hypothetical protein